MRIRWTTDDYISPHKNIFREIMKVWKAITEELELFVQLDFVLQQKRGDDAENLTKYVLMEWRKDSVDNFCDKMIYNRSRDKLYYKMNNEKWIRKYKNKHTVRWN